MKRIAHSVVALLLVSGLTIGGLGSGLGGGMTVRGGGIGCCPDAI